MGYKTILVPLEGTESDASVLETAIVAARLFDAHLEVLHVKADPRDMFPFVSEPATAGSLELVIEAAERSTAEKAAKAHALFEDACRRAQVTIASAKPASGGLFAMWTEEVGLIAEAVGRRGRLADLICVARPDNADIAPIALEAALMESGRPVLLAPPKPPGTLGSNIAVAWNGSAQAARALAFAMPFLARAARLTILTVKGRDEAVASPRDVSTHLAWHGIRASTKTVTAGARHAGAALLAETQGLGADLLVMGGYGHSRMREVIFGGVTQHILSSARLPVLLAH